MANQNGEREAGGHTPGPWIADHWGHADTIEIEGQTDREGRWPEIASIELDEHGAKPTPRQLANAHLIAAAPDLLAFVEKCVNEHDDHISPGLQIEAEILLAKAQGKS